MECRGLDILACASVNYVFLEKYNRPASLLMREDATVAIAAANVPVYQCRARQANGRKHSRPPPSDARMRRQ